MKSKLRQALRLIVFLLAVANLGGCAMTSIFSSYPSQIKDIKAQIDAKQFKLAQEKLAKETDGADKILYLMEKGRTSQIASNYTDSIADFKLAMEQIEANEEKAHITLTGSGAQAAATLTNDNAIPYEGDSYEHIFLHQFQALNYLFAKDLEAAVVEVRRANERQVEALQEHESEVAKAEQKDQENLQRNKGFMDKFKGLDVAAGRVKNSFQNAYTFYSSGVIYELLDKPNDAYIDYKKALEIFPDNSYLQEDVIRLATKLSMKDDLERYKSRFKVSPPTLSDNDGELIVFFEHGFAPPKLEVKVHLFTLRGNHSVAFPTYAPIWNITPPLSITDTSSNKHLGNTLPIVYVQALASKALKEKLPGMMLRQIFRVVAKNETQKKAAKTNEAFGAVMDIFNIVSENADQRSWLTLPNDAQIYRAPLAQGDHTLQLNNGTASGSINVKIVPGKKTILRVISTGKTVHTKSIVL